MVGNHIYVAGGEDVRKSERFNLEKEVWTELPSACDFDKFSCGVTMVTISNRYAFAIGGEHDDDFPETERFLRLDTNKLLKGWKILQIKDQKPFAFQGAFALETLIS